MTGIDDLIASMIERCVADRPPIANTSYVGYAVHPPQPTGNLLGLAVAHRGAGDVFVVDLVKEDITIEAAAGLVARYRVRRMCGAVGDDGDALAHAVAGAIHLLRLQ